MGRNIRRRQAQIKPKNELLKNKELKEKILNKNKNDDNQITDIFKFLGITIGIVAIVYFIFAIFITKEIDPSKFFDIFKKKEEPIVEINYKEILVGQTLNRSEADYYVLFYDLNDDDSATLETLVNQSLSGSTIYIVNTSNEFNKKYISNETGNREAKTISEMKVVSPTLIRVNAGQIVGYIETVNSILGYLKAI